jgi:glycosyltransferase involved in cell wall biosynthesis
MTSLASLSDGGSRRVVLFGSFGPSLLQFRSHLIREMIERGHEVYAVAPDIDEQVAKTLRSLGAIPLKVEFGRTSLNPFQALRTMRAVRLLMRQLRPDVVIAYTIKPIVLAAVAAKAAGVPKFIALVTGLGYAFTRGKEMKRLLTRAVATRLYRRAFAKTDLAIFQNKDDKEDFRRMRILPPSTMAVVINGSGIDLEHYVRSAPPQAVSFLMIGRLVIDKGVHEYGEAAKRLKLDYPSLKVGLVGWIGDEPHSITQKELDGLIAAGIEHHGYLPDVRSAIAAHSVYVLPSYREGTPRSVLEAMSIGRAIITTDTPGCRETVVPGENGLLVPPGDADALYQAMLHLIQNPYLIAPMGAASRTLAESKYDVRKVNAEFLRHAAL